MFMRRGAPAAIFAGALSLALTLTAIVLSAPPAVAQAGTTFGAPALPEGAVARALPVGEAAVAGARGATGREPAVAAEAGGAAWHDLEQRKLLALSPSLFHYFVPYSSDLIPPLSGRITSYFGWRDVSVGGNRNHGGIDLAADEGTPVLAARDGVVVEAGWVGAYGYSLLLDHGDGVETRYAHLSLLLAGVGDTVRQGDTIALSGNTGASTGPHLHFEVRIGGQTVDPLPYIQ